MSREIDRRDFSINKVTPARQEELHGRAATLSEGLPGEERVRIDGFDAVTGNPSMVLAEAAPAEKGNYIRRALDYVQRIGGTLGLEATQAPEYMADPHVQQTSSGSVAVHLQQLYKGIPIFQAAQAVRFAPDGALQETAGRTVTVERDLAVAPRVSVQEAVMRAAQHVAVPDDDEQEATDQFGQPLQLSSVDLTGFTPTMLASFQNKPERPAVLAAGPFADDIKASLTWFPIDDDLRLAWEVILTMPRYQGQFRTLVDTETGEILYCRQLMHEVAARGSVFLIDGDGPRRLVDFPRALAEYDLGVPGDLPSGFPDTWVASDSTAGNSTITRLGDDGPALRGAIRNGVVTFDPADPDSDDQKLLNLFYLNCFLHDYFYMLGFRETDGNFQQDDFDRGGTPVDRVDARVFNEPVFGTANMRTLVDGASPIMQMGPVTSTGRHTALDSSVVFHEFMHGVTNRLVGGPLNLHALDAIQSAGMGEGWGDFNACTLNDTTVVGAWVVDRPGGIRRFPYDSNFPDHFGLLGTGRYTEVHNIGEIWCATLMEMRRNIGKHLAVQLVVDALKLSPANPSFLDMRDAILTALQHKALAGQLTAAEQDIARRGIWQAFAKFGMGPAARSNGASLSGIVADFNMPDEPPPPQPALRAEAAPNLPIPDDDPIGVTHVLAIAQAGQVERLTVALDIEHTYIGDLRVRLISPAGNEAVLHNRAGANMDNLVKTYTSANTPALQALVGEQAQGEWRLHIADMEAVDVGTLRRWSIEIGLAATPLAPSAQLVSKGAQDDLQLINGIGPALERQLHRAGIRTYAQLAALTPDDLATQLGLGVLAARNLVKQDWIGQARALASHAAPAEAGPTTLEAARSEPDAAPGRQHYATFTVELLLGEDGGVRRTRVRHIQEGEQETWAGWEDGRLVRFFVEHADLPRRESDLAMGAQAGPQREADLLIEVSDVEVEPVAGEEQAGTTEVERLHATMSFQVFGLGASRAATEQTPYFVHFLAHMPANGETIVLAAIQGQLQPGQLDYTAQVDCAPPEIGRYQLLATVVLSDYNVVGAIIGPTLKVVP
jgi:extracellular elastinolytic metalloproteinase